MLKRPGQRVGDQRPSPIRVHLKVHHHVDLAHGGRKDGGAGPLARVMVEGADLVALAQRRYNLPLLLLTQLYHDPCADQSRTHAGQRGTDQRTGKLRNQRPCQM